MDERTTFSFSGSQTIALDDSNLPDVGSTQERKVDLSSGTLAPPCLAVVQSWLIPGFLGRYLTRSLVAFVLWATVWAIVGNDALPGGNLFGLAVLLAASSLGGFAVRSIPKLRLPSLLGMLVVGFLLKNVKGIDVGRDIDNNWSLTLRNVALVVILLRSGLGLNGGALRKAKWTISRLALMPCISEAVTVAVMGYLLLDMSFLWSFQLG